MGSRAMKMYSRKAFDPRASELNHEAYVAGCEFFENSQFKKASRSFQESLEYWPKDPQAWMALGNCYDELSKPKDAEKCFRRTLLYCEDKNRDDILYNLGNSLFDQDRYSEAIQEFEKVSDEAAAYTLAQKNVLTAKSRLKDAT